MPQTPKRKFTSTTSPNISENGEGSPLHEQDSNSPRSAAKRQKMTTQNGKENNSSTHDDVIESPKQKTSETVVKRQLFPLLHGQVSLSHFTVDAIATFEQLLKMHLSPSEFQFVEICYRILAPKLTEQNHIEALEKLQQLFSGFISQKDQQAFNQVYQYHQNSLKFLHFKALAAKPIMSSGHYKNMADLFITLTSMERKFFDANTLGAHYVELFSHLQGERYRISELQSIASTHVNAFSDPNIQETFYANKFRLNPNDIQALLECISILSSKIQNENLDEKIQTAKKIHQYISNTEDALGRKEIEEEIDLIGNEEFHDALSMLKNNLSASFSTIPAANRSLDDWKYIHHNELTVQDWEIIFDLTLKEIESNPSPEKISNFIKDFMSYGHETESRDTICMRLMALHQTQCNLHLKTIQNNHKNHDAIQVNSAQISKNMEELSKLIAKVPDCSGALKALLNSTKATFATMIILCKTYAEAMQGSLMTNSPQNPAANLSDTSSQTSKNKSASPKNMNQEDVIPESLPCTPK